MRRGVVGLAGGAAAVLAIGAWWWLTPSRLGLKTSRVVLVSGDALLDERRAHASDPIAPGASVRTGALSEACFSVHASRVCLGSGTQARLDHLGDHDATITADRGTLVLASSGDELKVTIGASSVTARGAVAAVEMNGVAPTVRVLAGAVTIERAGHPSAEVSTGAVGLNDGAQRPSVPMVEAEERAGAQIAGRWQGSAGATVTVNTPGARVSLDGVDVGRTPFSMLLDEGSHALAVREGNREGVHETLDLKAGQKVVRGPP